MTTDRAPTLTEALRAVGVVHRRATDNGTRELVDAETGEIIGCFSASTAWEWLRAGCPREAEA